MSKSIVDRFQVLAVASISDALARRGIASTMDHEIKPVFRKKLVGPAVTVSEEQADGAGAPTHALEAIDHAAPGSVMVIGVGGERNVAVWGGLMTAGAHARGLAGAVLDGGARDIEEIERDYEFAVYARSVSPNTTVGRFRTIASDVPVVCGGVTVRPGDWIVGDADGVVVVPAELAEAVATEAEEIEAVERAQTEAIKTAGSLVAAVETYRRI